MTDEEYLDALLGRADDWHEWMGAFVEDPVGETWAHPCPSCGVLVTDPLAHLRRAHGNTFEMDGRP